jgi:hypothetical protein
MAILLALIDYHNYYMERNDKIIAKLLQEVVDQVETLFDKRLAWNRGIRKELLIVLKNVNLKYESETIICSDAENASLAKVEPDCEVEAEAALRKAIEILGGKKEDYEAILNGKFKEEEFLDWQQEINLKYDLYIQNQIKHEKEKKKKEKLKNEVVENERVDKDYDLFLDAKLEKQSSWNDDDSSDIVVVANLDLSNRAS